MMNSLNNQFSNPVRKIYSLQEFVNILDKIERPLVMTNGVFDIIHRGHVNYLHQASKLGATLLVAVNSDASVRMLGKGPDRPLNTADDRAYVLAGLSSVDFLIIFNEQTPVNLIKLIRPDIYVKGGDYNMEIIEESIVIRSWGGRSTAIPFVEGFSTTSLVKKIRHANSPLRRAVFLDRDGVINKDKGYVHSWNDFEFLDGAIEGMQMLQKAGYTLVIVTNQSGLARGYYTNNDYELLSSKLLSHLKNQGVIISGIFHCPHHPNGIVESLSINCNCRKPKHGLLYQAANSLGLDLSKSLLIGDKETDIQAARSAKLNRAYLISSESNFAIKGSTSHDGEFPSLLSCVNYILRQENSCIP